MTRKLRSLLDEFDGNSTGPMRPELSCPFCEPGAPCKSMSTVKPSCCAQLTARIRYGYLGTSGQFGEVGMVLLTCPVTYGSVSCTSTAQYPIGIRRAFNPASFICCRSSRV